MSAWGLGLFAALTVLSIAAQNVFWIALAGWLGVCAVRRQWPALPALGWVWLAFLAWALFASTQSENAAHSVVTWRKWLLAVAAWCTAVAVADLREWRRLAGILLIAAALVNLGGVLAFGLRPFWAWSQGQAWSAVAYHWVYDTEWRARGGSGGYMVLAAVDAMLLAFYGGLLSLDARWRRPLVWACLGMIALGLLFTMTRGAWLAAAAGLGLLLLLQRPRWAAALVAAGLLFALLFPQSVFVQRLRTVTDKDNDSNRERVYLAQAGLSIVRQHPWSGVGDAIASWEQTRPDGSVESVPGWFLRSRSPEAIEWYESKHVADKDNGHLHDTPLQLAAMYGLPGLALAALFFGSLFFWGLACARDASLEPLGRGAGLGLSAGLLTLSLHSLTEYNLGSFQTSFTLWFVIGLAAAGVRLSRRAEAL
jgi:O-antigen ligase